MKNNLPNLPIFKPIKHAFMEDAHTCMAFSHKTVGLVIALRSQTPKQIRGGWSHYTDTSEPVNGNGTQNMFTVQSGFEPATFRSLAHELTNYSNRAHTKA
jgi:hypothetical protein